MRAYLAAILVVVVFLCGSALGQTPDPVPAPEEFAVEVFGNERGAEARFLVLGPLGGAVGLYGGASDGAIENEDAARFGAIARYAVIVNGAAPVANLFPQLLAQFLMTFGLPATTPVNSYAGLSIGGLYGYESEDLSWEIRPHVGVQAGMVGMEISRGLGDLTGEQDAGSEWLVSVGVGYRW